MNKNTPGDCRLLPDYYFDFRLQSRSQINAPPYPELLPPPRGWHRVLRAPSRTEVARGKPWTLKYLNYFRPDFEPSRHV